MFANYFKLTVVVASLMFVTGFISLMVLSTTKVLPAPKGLDFEKATCRVTHSEISCATNNCSDDVGDGNSRCLKVYVLCGDDKFINNNRNDSSDKHIGYLLRKDVYHLNNKCSYEIAPDIIHSDPDSSRKNLEDLQLQKGKPGSTFKFYRNPRAPDEVVYENHSKEEYRHVVVQSVLWPVALIAVSILILISAMCCWPTRREYRRIP